VVNGFDPKNDWHIYELVWTPDFMAWRVDNKEVRRVKSEDPSVELTDKPQSVVMNFWTPVFESWGKDLDAKDMPWTVEYDYVETYTYCTKENTFDFHWRDEFDTLDTKRWNVSDNKIFGGSSTTFRSSQVSVNNGNLVLTMEPEQHDEHHMELFGEYPVEHTLPIMSMP